MPSYTAASRSPAAGVRSPISVSGGERKSLTAVPSRRNSGFTQKSKSRPSRASPRSTRRQKFPQQDVAHHRASHRDQRMRVAAPQPRRKLVGDMEQLAVIERAMIPTGRSDANQRDVSPLHRGVHVAGRPELAVADEPHDHFRQARLGDWRGAGVDVRDFFGVDVDTGDDMTEVRETGRRHASHITETKDGDLHECTPAAAM